MNNSKLKTVVFVSNFFNHHQRPFCEEMYKLLGDGYKFVETAPMSQERKNLGWGEQSYPDYVISHSEFSSSANEIQTLIYNADAVILGSASKSLIEQRIKSKKLTFIYSERPLKDNSQKWKYPFRFITWRIRNKQKSFIKLLCASAYTSADYAKFGLYRNKCYKWAYFPELKKYPYIKDLIESKKPNSILWVARLMKLKHPEAALKVAEKLKNDGYSFEMNIIGNGYLEQSMANYIAAKNLGNCVHMLGSMSPGQVRNHMEESEIFLFTSDRNEGWGAVLNESMNSGCAVVASHAIGSVPFLMEDGKNGFIYKDGDIDDLYNKVKYLLDNAEVRKTISEKAYLTIKNEWNAENAARKFTGLAEKILCGEKYSFPYDCGVCSKAKKLSDNWVYRIKGR